MKMLSHRSVSIVFLSVAVAALLPCLATAATCDKPVATMVSVQGTVELQRVGESGWQPAVLDETFCAGDMIRVGENSRADLVLASEAAMRLNENTSITLQEFKENRKSFLDLFKGAAHFLSRQPESLEVNTPYTIAGVRGTEFFIRVDADQTFLSIFQGNVLVANKAGELNITSGQSAVAEAGKAPVLKVVARPRDAVQWALYYPPVMYDVSPDLIQQSSESIRDPNLLAQRAALLLNVGRVDAASADLERALALDPNNGNALALQSIIAIVQNDKDKAITLARKAVDAAPKSATAWIALSYAKQARFDLEGARENLYEATRVDPGNALAWARLSEIEASFGRLDKSLDAAKKAESLAPNLSLTQNVLGFAYLTQVNIDAAKAAFKKAITFDQAAPLPHLGLGLAIIREGHLEEGGRQIEVAASLDPNNSLIRSYLGKTYYEEKRIPLDEKEYAIAKELDANDPTPWFYDAIAKQTTNRPVEALKNMEKAIELNNNRAVYRSKLQLDSDLASRSSSLARIYNNLGFQQRGLVTGWESVNTDPSNFSAHRFLSDSYSVLPRHEIARVSELLQSQLLQPINITPIQPQLAESNLFLISSQGPSAAGFNAYNPLFNSNQATLQANGLAGSNQTWGGEGIASGIYNKLSLSAGYNYFKTDGYRDNNDQKDQIANFFAQYELTYKTSIQTEYRYRDTNYGDLEQKFFSEDDKLDLRTTEETNLIRIGLRHSFTPASVLIGNIAYQDKDTNVSDKPAAPADPTQPVLEAIDVNGDGQKAYSGELGYLFRSQYVNFAAGAGYFDINAEQQTTLDLTIPGITIPLPPPLPPITLPPQQVTNTEKTDRDVQHTNLYLYSYIKLPKNVTFTLGASEDFFDTNSPDAENKDQFNPKIGVSWNLFTNTTLRAAAFRVLKRSLITDQTLEPTQVAGFNQFFDDPDGTESWVYGAAIDQKFTNSIFGGLELSKRDLKVPYQEFNVANGSVTSEINETDWDEYLGRAYLFWAPIEWLSLTAEYLYEKSGRTQEFNAGIKEVKTQRVPLGMNFFHPIGLSLFLKATYFNQDGEFQRLISGNFESGSDQFWIADAALSYRLPKRYGFITFGVTNLFDKEYNYQDTDIKNPIIQTDRTIFGRITLAIP
jgi:tetratricopeptide (TPR) repeat protein